MIKPRSSQAIEAASAPNRPCAVCGGTRAAVFWEAASVPVFCNVLCRTREEALKAPRGDLRLTFCPDCALIVNTAFDPRRVAYGVDYENSLHHSPHFQTYADALACRLVEQYRLHNKVVVEIACGQGDFLRALCAAGGNIGLGFDPSYVPKDNAAPGMKRVTFVQDYYSPRYADRRADFVCCRHALEHMANPVEFLRGVRQTLDGQPEAIVFFEVPNAMWTLRELGIWDLIYEHCTYFVDVALERCFLAAGFQALSTAEEYGGQFLTLEARPNGAAGGLPQVAVNDPVGVGEHVRAFADQYTRKVRAWQARLAEWKAAGKRTMVWGSGSKGVTFLNVLAASSGIEYVVDINPRKQGMFVAGTGQRIVAPDFVRAYRPDEVIVMNPVYVDEIRRMLGELGVTREVQVA
jgi:hypothetical protein